MALDPQLVIMAKRPEIGRVKTRLARDIGKAEALRFFRGASASLIRRVARDPRWQTVIAVAPDMATHNRGIWPADIPRVPQGSGDLGARMGRLFRELPPGPVIIIGADIPGITSAHVASAFAALGNRDAVLGPADDGGYWLVGLRRRLRIAEIFDNVRWSSEHAFADTARNICRQGLSLAVIGILADIDTGDDFRTWRRGA